MLFFYQNFALEHFFRVWTEKTFEAQCYPTVHEISVILANLSKCYSFFGFSQCPIGCLIFMNMSIGYLQIYLWVQYIQRYSIRCLQRYWIRYLQRYMIQYVQYLQEQLHLR